MRQEGLLRSSFGPGKPGPFHFGWQEMDTNLKYPDPFIGRFNKPMTNGIDWHFNESPLTLDDLELLRQVLFYLGSADPQANPEKWSDARYAARQLAENTESTIYAFKGAGIHKLNGWVK